MIPSPLNLTDVGAPKVAAAVPGMTLIGVFVKVGKPNTLPGIELAALLELLAFELMLDELVLDELDELAELIELALLLLRLELTLDVLLRELVLALLNELEVADEVAEELTDD